MLATAAPKASLLHLNRPGLEALLKGDVPAMILTLPTAAGRQVKLQLVKVEITTPDFSVVTSDSNGQPVPFEPGAHYRGIVKGKPNSLAAISVFHDEVMGIYSTEEDGNFVLGKVAGDNPEAVHILYSDREIKPKIAFECGMKDNGAKQSSVELSMDPAYGRCARIFVEADYDLYLNKGSVLNVINYVTGFFNQSRALFGNEGIPVLLSELFVWSSPSPYTGNDSATLLVQFQSNRNSFNGDLAAFVCLKNIGGRAAGFDGFCNSNPDNQQCVAGIAADYQNVPTYSFTVYVFTHEVGHLMGSRHTHACVWNGNNTAIDSCAGSTEGGCPLPGNPPGGGTIMSYCNNTPVGINFSLGFGPQPGNVIRSHYNGAGCLGNCSPNYAGYIDSADCNYISGWAADRNRLGIPITVSIYNDSSLLATVSAQQLRADVGAYLGDNGMHGFNIPTPISFKDGNSHTLRVLFESSFADLGNSFRTIYCPPSASVAWVKPSSVSWGPPNTLTVAGYAQNGSGGVQMLWYDATAGGDWNVVAWQPTPNPADNTWSNTIPVSNYCHDYQVYVNYSGIQSPVFPYYGLKSGYCTENAHTIWIQPQFTAGFGPPGSLVVAGSATGGPSGTQVYMHYRDATAGDGWTLYSFAPVPDANGTWYNSIPNVDFNHHYQVWVTYDVYSSVGVCEYYGNNSITWCQ